MQQPLADVEHLTEEHAGMISQCLYEGLAMGHLDTDL